MKKTMMNPLFVLTLMAAAVLTTSGAEPQFPTYRGPQTSTKSAFTPEQIDQAVAEVKWLDYQVERLRKDVDSLKTLQPDSLDASLTRSLLREQSVLRDHDRQTQKTIEELTMRLAAAERKIAELESDKHR